jgi:hypothetical protein
MTTQETCRPAALHQVTCLYVLPTRQVLFQTWKTNRVGPKTHKVVMRWLTENPEYEYVFMTDEDVAEFMCTTANHATLTAYDALKAGACRSVRLLVNNLYSCRHTGKLTLICPTAGFSAPSKHVGQTSGGSRSFTGTEGYMSTQTAGK